MLVPRINHWAERCNAFGVTRERWQKTFQHPQRFSRSRTGMAPTIALPNLKSLGRSDPYVANKLTEELALLKQPNLWHKTTSLIYLSAILA